MYDAEAELKRLVRRWRGRGRGRGEVREEKEERVGEGDYLENSWKVCDTKVKLKRLVMRRWKGEGDGGRKEQEG